MTRQSKTAAGTGRKKVMRGVTIGDHQYLVEEYSKNGKVEYYSVLPTLLSLKDIFVRDGGRNYPYTDEPDTTVYRQPDFYSVRGKKVSFGATDRHRAIADETILEAVRKTFGDEANEYQGWEASYQEETIYGKTDMHFIKGSKKQIGVVESEEPEEEAEIHHIDDYRPTLKPPRRKEGAPGALAG